jgi:hypothetical protein
MALKSWILPILLGIVAAFFLMSILYMNPYMKQKFYDLGAIIQLQTSRPFYYPALQWVATDGGYRSTEAQPPPYASYNSPGYDGSIVPVYNYFPQTPLNPVSTPPATIQPPINDLAFASQPSKDYNSHLAAYYGSFPYVMPFYAYPPTDIDKVKGVQDRI